MTASTANADRMLISRLVGGSAHGRQRAALSLRLRAERGDETVIFAVEPLVARVLYDSHKRIRIMALDALSKISAASKIAFGLAAFLLQDQDESLRHSAILVLADLDDYRDAAVPLIAHMLSRPEHQLTAALQLKQFGKVAAPAISALEQVAQSDSPWAWGAREALEQIAAP